MKYLVVVSIALFAFAGAEDNWQYPTNGPAIQEGCAQKAGMTNEDLEQVFEEIEANKLQEFTYCVMTEMGLFTEEHGFYNDRMMAHLKAQGAESAETKEIVTKCVDSNEQKSPSKEWIVRVMKCINQNKMKEMIEKAHQENAGKSE